MLLSEKQFKGFWAKHPLPGKTSWPAIVAAKGWDHAESERQRKAMLARAGFTSLTLVDPGAGYTRVLHEMDALRDDLTGMLQHTDLANQIRVLTHTIRSLSAQITGRPEHQADGYWIAIARDKFDGLDRLFEMTIPQLTQLRDTLARALSAKRRKARAPQPVEADCPF